LPVFSTYVRLPGLAIDHPYAITIGHELQIALVEVGAFSDVFETSS
jgi:hypothetical protein